MSDQSDKSWSMNSNVVGKLFEALAKAQQQPATFTIESRTADSIGGYAVLVLPEGLFTQAVKPALKQMGYDVVKV